MQSTALRHVASKYEGRFDPHSLSVVRRRYNSNLSQWIAEVRAEGLFLTRGVGTSCASALFSLAQSLNSKGSAHTPAARWIRSLAKEEAEKEAEARAEGVG